jgi:hypothetical protein
MTLILISLTTPSTDGARRPAAGSLRFEPTRRLTAPPDVTLPVPATVALDAGGRATVTLLPSGADWCWRVMEAVTGGIVRYVAVPDSEETVDYATLTDIDPATLTPAEPAVPAWTDAVARMQDALESVATLLGVTPSPRYASALRLTYRSYLSNGASIRLPITTGGTL